MAQNREKWNKAVSERITKHKAALLEQFRKMPILQIALERAGISRATYYDWRDKDEAFRKDVDQAITDGEALITDMSESQLISLVRDKHFPAVQMWLRHHHPAYTNKLEIKHAMQDENLTPEQEALVREALRLASTSQLEITNLNQQTYEPQNPTSAGAGGSDDQGQESTGGNH